MSIFHRLGLFGLLLAGSSLAAEYIIKFKDTTILPQKTFHQAMVLDTHEAGQLAKVRIDNKNMIKTLSTLIQDPSVEYVVENFQLKAFSTPISRERLREQWANVKVNAEKAWGLANSYGSNQVIIAVIDTGVDYNHPNLKSNMIPGYDFHSNDDDPMDDTGAQNPGHGTHCAGSLGANGLVEGGVIGLSPRVSIMPIRFLGANGSGDLMAAIKSIDYAIQKGAHIISASWGAGVSESQARPLIEAVKRASDAGVIFVAAAANDGANNDNVSMYPANANFENTITVAASDAADQKPRWSNYGKRRVSLAAPGNDIMSTLPKNKWGKLSGTSMATPLVSGLVALLKSQDMSLTGAQVRSLLQSTGAKVNIETACNCRVDAAAAMEHLLEKKPYIVPAAWYGAKGQTQKFTMMNATGALQFRSTNPSVATISADGTLTGIADGETTVEITDASGVKLTSLPIYIGGKSSDGGDGTPPGECPLGNPILCEAACAIMPQLPWCSQ